MFTVYYICLYLSGLSCASFLIFNLTRSCFASFCLCSTIPVFFFQFLFIFSPPNMFSSLFSRLTMNYFPPHQLNFFSLYILHYLCFYSSYFFFLFIFHAFQFMYFLPLFTFRFTSYCFASISFLLHIAYFFFLTVIINTFYQFYFFSLSYPVYHTSPLLSMPFITYIIPFSLVPVDEIF